jgi:hypothetical protein
VNRARKFSDIEGGEVVWPGRNLAHFTQPLQDHYWDLVILAVESRWTVELGETGLLEQIYALIVETWNLPVCFNLERECWGRLSPVVKGLL